MKLHLTARLAATALAATAAVAALPATAGADNYARATAAEAIPTPENYRRAHGRERAEMVRAARPPKASLEGTRYGRVRAAFVGKIDPSYGFVCRVIHVPAHKGPLGDRRPASRHTTGIGVRKVAGRWKGYEMSSGAMQTYNLHCDA